MPDLDAFGIAVRDMAATVSFYSLLGLEFAPGAAGEGHVEVELPGGVRVMFDAEDIMKSFDPDWEVAAGRGRVGLAFRCVNPVEVDEMHHRVLTAGFRSHLEPFDAFWGQRYAAVVDPNGVIVDLYAPLDD